MIKLIKDLPVDQESVLSQVHISRRIVNWQRACYAHVKDESGEVLSIHFVRREITNSLWERSLTLKLNESIAIKGILKKVSDSAFNFSVNDIVGQN